MSDSPYTKTNNDYFRDWERHVFRYGYGTGEDHIIPALKAFMAAVPSAGGYDYRTLEVAVGPVPAWLFINRLHAAGLFDYGVSPRFAWLTMEGLRLKSYLDTNEAAALIDIATSEPPGYVECMPDACNCGPDGYVARRRCPNPFWKSKGTTP